MIETKRLYIKDVSTDFDLALHSYVNRNKEFLEEWELKKEEEYYTLEYQKKKLEEAVEKNHIDRGLRFYIFPKDDENKIIGTIGISNIIRGCFQSCHLGYALDKDYINQGLMSEAILALIDYAFNDLRLHRIEANIMPKNISSQRVLEKTGFINEGVSKDYLLINGKWEDHIHMVKLNANY